MAMQRRWQRGKPKFMKRRPIAMKNNVSKLPSQLAKHILPTIAVASILLATMTGTYANPTGGQVTSGSGTIAQSGNAMTITQTTDKLSINWRSFGIGAGEKVQFIQPGKSSVALNRVVGNNASAIYGTLSANGKVFLVNPNGVLFAPSAQVNVGGLVASSLNLSDSDFIAGKYKFSGNGGSIVNQGNITASDGGFVALLGSQVKNEGIIIAQKGMVALGAGSNITLDMNGDGLINLAVNQGALQALSENNHIIQADGGQVIMTARAADTLAVTVVNNSGMIQAKSISNVNGVIRLDGGTSGWVTNSGTLDASGMAVSRTGGTIKVLGDNVELTGLAKLDASGTNGGGTILVGGNYQGQGPEQNAANTYIDSGVIVNADAINQGDGGKVVVWANNKTVFSGQISARGGETGGDGGSVEVSGKQKLVYNGFTDLKATNGKDGNLLLDPTDYTIAASGGDITGTALGTQLGSANVTIVSSNGANGVNGDIFVNDAVSWTGSNTLKLSADRDINISAPITSTNGGLTITAGSAGIIRVPSAVSVGTFTLTKGTWRQIGALPYFFANDFGISGGTFIRALSGDGSSGNPYQITDVYGLQGVGSAGMLNKNYILANNIDASGTTGWNENAGFAPIGKYTGISSTEFSGNFNGRGYTIDKLIVYRLGTTYVGLFGFTSYGAQISDVGLANLDIRGGPAVGGLVGHNGGSIKNSYSTGMVRSSNGAGAGGLAGFNTGSITNSYSTTNVTGSYSSQSIGGLAGVNWGATITNSYSMGTVSGGSFYIGGLVGQSNGGITNSYWNTSTSGMVTSNGGSGLTTAQMMNPSNFTGWDFSNTWRIYNGYTTPLLKVFMTPITVTANNASRTYDGSSSYGGNGVTYSNPSATLFGTLSYLGTAQGARNAGDYSITPTGLYSTGQQGYDITYVDGTLSINKAALTIKANDSSRHIWSSNPDFTATYTGLVGTDTSNSLSGNLLLTTTATPLSVSGSYPIIPSGLSSSNYNIGYVNGTLRLTQPDTYTFALSSAARTAVNINSHPWNSNGISRGTGGEGTLLSITRGGLNLTGSQTAISGINNANENQKDSN